MSFQIKDFISIVASMVNHMRGVTTKITDYNVGSVARTLIEAPALEIDELYQQMVHGLVEAIPTAIYRSFDFTLKPAVAASGLVRFSCDPAHTEPVVLPVGVVVASTTGVQYQTIEAVTIPVGQDHADVVATALVAGPDGNTLADTITVIVSSASGATSVTNPTAFANGRGEETEDERRLRFAEYVKSLARGTVGSLVYAAKNVQLLDPSSGTVLERVERVSVDEGPGHVSLYVYNGSGNTSAALVEEVRRVIDGYDDADGELVPGFRPAGMRVDVRAMTEIPINASITAEVAALNRTDETEAQIKGAMSAVIRATRSGGSLRPVDLVNAVMVLPRVSGAGDVTPSFTVPCPASAVLVPGILTVNWQ
ncbi:baseplate J/gp47 family protein [Azospirillum sp.]|uniref:baseplate J/gp47 family protein n=1 Tax=Azospirillum sp. TaxID=34012 RepID=UPI003D737101